MTPHPPLSRQPQRTAQVIHHLALKLYARAPFVLRLERTRGNDRKAVYGTL